MRHEAAKFLFIYRGPDYSYLRHTLGQDSVKEIMER